MITQFKDFIDSTSINHAPVLIAVSGGIDSMVLVSLFSQLSQHYAIAHCNFQLRGEESNKDEQFVKELASTLKVECFIERFNTNEVAREEKISIQMAARKLRYDWLEKIRSENNFHSIITAHHRNDSVETVLLNLIKGTGIRGLHGILPKVGKIIRPLLFAGKNEIRKYAEDNKITFREDSSNKKTDYERNLIRLKVIPLLQEINPSFIKTMDENSKHFKHAEEIYLYGLGKLLKKLMRVERGSVVVDLTALMKSPAPSLILFELFNLLGFDDLNIDQIIESFGSQSGKEFISANHRIIKDRKKIFITDKNSSESPVYLIEKRNSQTIKVGVTAIEIRIKEATSRKRDGLLEMDADKIAFPVTLRVWKTGDYFYPSGMKMKKKKLSNFFVDLKIPLHEKEKQLVIQDADDKIICVVGLRTDERFAVTVKTKNYFMVRQSL